MWHLGIWTQPCVETVWSVLKHPLLIGPDWQGLEQEDRMWREQTSFMVSFLLPDNCKGAGGCWEVSRLLRSQLIRSQFLGSVTRRQLNRQKGKVRPVMKGAVRSPVIGPFKRSCRGTAVFEDHGASTSGSHKELCRTGDDFYWMQIRSNYAQHLYRPFYFYNSLSSSNTNLEKWAKWNYPHLQMEKHL